MASWTRPRKPDSIEQLHQLHRAVMGGAPVDSQSPIGKWKSEPNGTNGTNTITTRGNTKWHDYAEPKHVPH